MNGIKKNITIKNQIPNFLLKSKILKKQVKESSVLIKDIFENVDDRSDNFSFLSKNFKLNFKKSDLKRFQKFNTVVVIGMGGSVLASKAIYSFLNHKIKKKFIFFDNLDEINTKKILKSKKIKDSLFIIISKSGNTLETIANVNLLNIKNFNKNNTIVITEKRNNAIFNFAKKRKIFFIEHKKFVGGRYSVFTEVGMVPAFFMGLKIDNFRSNLKKYFKINKSFLINSVSKISQIYSQKKFSSLVLLVYCPHLKEFIAWVQQLMAESLGKKNMGLMPIISEAPKDHHSLLQLYLDGPRDKLFYLISGDSPFNLKIKKNYFEYNYNFLKNKKMKKILDEQKNSLAKVLNRKKIPFREVIVNKLSEKAIGELFAYFILETVLVGKILRVNPFNQPAVEEVKILTRKKLF
tara:strand:- start:65 stop:1285 length:1221 start_codon:yes stop_codon:yes gene_type:complete